MGLIVLDDSRSLILVQTSPSRSSLRSLFFQPSIAQAAEGAKVEPPLDAFQLEGTSSAMDSPPSGGYPWQAIQDENGMARPLSLQDDLPWRRLSMPREAGESDGSRTLCRPSHSSVYSAMTNTAAETKGRPISRPKSDWLPPASGVLPDSHLREAVRQGWVDAPDGPRPPERTACQHRPQAGRRRL